MKKSLFFIYTKSIGFYINILGFVFPAKAVKLAHALFSSPRKGRLQESDLPEVLKEAEIKKYDLESNYFYTYTWKGNDTVVLLIHGWESNSSRWKKMLPYLKQSGSTIIAIDGPAHGLSSGKEFNVPLYTAFMDVVVQEYKPRFLIGHSIGGKACMYYQYKYKRDCIEKIVVLGAPCDFISIINNYIQLLWLNKNVYTGLKKYYLDRYEFDIAEFSAKLFVTNSTAKGLVVHDTGDKVVLFKEGEKIVSYWKDSILFKTKGLGHGLQSKSVFKKIANFLFNTPLDE